jgi:hypothetical protein
MRGTQFKQPFFTLTSNNQLAVHGFHLNNAFDNLNSSLKMQRNPGSTMRQFPLTVKNKLLIKGKVELGQNVPAPQTTLP